MTLDKLHVPGRPTNLDLVGQGPTALAIGSVRSCVDIFSLSFLLLSGRRPDIDEILSQRAVKPKNNQLTNKDIVIFSK